MLLCGVKHGATIWPRNPSPPEEQVTYTLDRDLAQADDSLDLIGIDHRITFGLPEQWRAAAPSVLGATAKVGLERTAVLSSWPAHSFGGASEKGTHLIPIAVDLEGKSTDSM